MGGSRGSSSPSPLPTPGGGGRDARHCEGGVAGMLPALRGAGWLEMSKESTGKVEVAKELSTGGCPWGGGWLW